MKIGEHLLVGIGSNLRLLDAYQAIKYREDVAETCTEARKFYPDDAEIGRSCASVPTVT